MMRMPHFLLLIVLTGLGVTGCEAPGTQARKTLQTQMAVRRENQARSMESYRHGQKAYTSGDADAAQKHLLQAVALDDQNAYAWMTLGLVHYQSDRLYDAAAAFDRAARLKPDRYEPQFNMGSVLETCGRYPAAIQAYEKALRLAPDRIEVMENLARCYIRTRSEPAKTKELIDSALAQDARPEWQAWLKQQKERLARLAEQSTGPSTQAAVPETDPATPRQ